MNRFKSAAVATKNFVVRHKTAVAVTATAAVLIAANRVAIRDFQQFIEQNGLTEEFIAWNADA